MERKRVLWGEKGQVAPGHVVSESPAILGRMSREDWERLARSLQLGV